MGGHHGPPKPYSELSGVRLGLAVFIDFVCNHMMWGRGLKSRHVDRLLEKMPGAQYIYGPQLFQEEALFIDSSLASLAF